MFKPEQSGELFSTDQLQITIATDDWGRVSGVVRSYEETKAELETMGHRVSVIEPSLFFKLCKGPQDVPVVIVNPFTIWRRLNPSEVDAVHIATEGPIGFWTKLVCWAKGIRYSTAYHTNWATFFSGSVAKVLAPVERRMPWLARAIVRVVERFGWFFLRWFHAGAGKTMARPAIAPELIAQGYKNVCNWKPGLRFDQFSPEKGQGYDPTVLRLLYIGRLSGEKRIDRLFELNLEKLLARLRTAHPDLPVTAISLTIVGHGPLLEPGKAAYPHIHFPGVLTGEPLAIQYASADVFVNPSDWETFGRTVLEGLASGLSIVSVSGGGPELILSENRESGVGVIDDDLEAGIVHVAAERWSNREESIQACKALAGEYTIRKATEQFLLNLVPATSRAAKAMQKAS